MAPDHQRGKREADRKEDGTDGGSRHGVHALERTAHARPGEKEREYNAERDNLIQVQVERKERCRPRARDVNLPPGGLCRQAVSTCKLGYREPAAEGKCRSQQWQEPHGLRAASGTTGSRTPTRVRWPRAWRPWHRARFRRWWAERGFARSRSR